MNIKKIYILPVLLIFFINHNIHGQNYENPYLKEWKIFANSKNARTLLTWLRKNAISSLKNGRINKTLPVKTPPYLGRVGIFITLKKGRDVRGCFGAFDHSFSRINILLLDYLDGALKRDLRHDPLELSEIDDIKIIVTITTTGSPVYNIDMVDLTQNGILINCEGSHPLVFVPAELRTISYLQKYIKNDTCSISAFRAVTIEE